MIDTHIATHIGTRLAIHDETEWLAYPQYGCPDTYDGELVDGAWEYNGVTGLTIHDVLDRLDEIYGPDGSYT